jgi:ABC-type transporter Mla maintaining outer membrane lipid asymmetry ATPase subunit MlaF
MTDSASRPERMDTQAPSVVGEAIRVAYRGRLVLDVEQIELPVGKTYALLGASGAGKSRSCAFSVFWRSRRRVGS